MTNIKIILLLSLAAYVACGGGDNPPFEGTTWDDVNNEYGKPSEPITQREPFEPSEPIEPSKPFEPSDTIESSEPIEPSEPNETDTPILSHYEVYDPNFDYRANFDYSGCLSIQGNGGTVTLNSGGNRESINAISGFVHVRFRDDALFINGIKVPEVQANDVRLIQWAGGSLSINGMKIERFNGMRGYGTMHIS